MPISSSSKLLLIIGAAVAILVVLSVAVTLARGSGGTELLSGDTAEGTVQRYILALEEGDFAGAYATLSPALQERCTLEEYERFSGHTGIGDSRVRLGESRDLSSGREVTVTVTYFSGAPPFGGESTTEHRYVASQFNGEWRLTQVSWPYFGCPFIEKPLRAGPEEEERAPTATPTLNGAEG